MCRSRRELSNAYLLAKFVSDTAENEPCKVGWLQRSSGRYRSLLEATFTWVMNDGCAWEDAKRLPDVPETDEDAAAWVGEVGKEANDIMN